MYFGLWHDGKAILSGIFASMISGQDGDQTYTPKKYIVCTSREESGARIRNFNNKVTLLVEGNVKGVNDADIDGMAQALENKLLINILAGVTINQLEQWVPLTTKIIRAMPNAPCMIREGMTVISCRNDVKAEDKEFASWDE
ncbi:3634_t:CDS:2 [Diversispora eburnea]|uniref:3634_t:CDS:1 n=1 Tax=Diversispora eburnea TaxID=1213867 RepID=A0A9N8ZTT4_9GLOM|nr:3634_t:CDS:2 [Diversispora eburnea]